MQYQFVLRALIFILTVGLLAFRTGDLRADVIKSRIIGGQDASASAYPWMAALLDAGIDDSTEAHFCGAALIAPQYLITAAHCVNFDFYPLSPNSLQVMIGQNKLPFSRGDRQNIIGIFTHPEFNPFTLENDVALLKLEAPVTVNYLDFLQPGQEKFVSEGKRGTILGWGSTDPLRPILPVDLKEAQIPIHNDQRCLDSLGRFFKPLSMLCAGTLSSNSQKPNGKDACYGDSGGPLFVDIGRGQLRLAGTVSWGFVCADTKTYGVYSDVMQLSSFLGLRPLAAPVITGPLFVNGTAIVGDKLTCDGAVIKGDAADSVSYAWYNDYGEIAAGAEYVTKESDAYSYLYCAVSAANAGGVTTLYSDNFVLVTPPEDSGNSQDTIGTESIVDTTPPTISLDSRRCIRSQCTLTLSINDDSGESEVAHVEALYSKETKLQNCSTEKCSRVTSGTLEGEALGNGLWSFNSKVPRSGSFKIIFRVRASDRSGNISPGYFKVQLRRRARS